ncbi:MAG TPA: 30S ribosomal protein S9 [Candidatus Paceibacterota bacterium]|nr:30S ribosomal protein S9 [Candidatus Paceibacterota bacterium]HRZ29963.1 30S ribosomal protein S9 [Candidatus Paceibacterota bacterium]
MAPVKKTTKKETTKAKGMSKKPTVKKTASKSVATVEQDIKTELKKPIVKREHFDNPIHKADKKSLHEFKGKYVESVGRRKTSIARVRFYLNDNGFSVNNKSLNEYFPLKEIQDQLTSPLRLTDTFNKFAISIKVQGGGFNAQCQAATLGISRCLVKYDDKLKTVLRHNGLLSRDARIVERKKYGLHKARRAPQ